MTNLRASLMLPIPPKIVRMKTDDGLEWDVDIESGRGVRVTPHPRASSFRKNSNVRHFPPLKGLGDIESPQPSDVLFGYLLSARPKTAEAVHEILTKDFAGTSREAREIAAKRYIDAWLSPVASPRSP